MAGSFSTKKNQDSVYAFIRGIAKKTFFISFFLYYLSHLFVQLHITAISSTLDTTILLGLLLAGFIFMITFADQTTKQSRISRSDWALIGLFGVISIGFNIISANEMELIGTIAAIVLLLFAFGLILYVWNGSDDTVTFSLFKRDKRFKLPTYIKATFSQWITSIILITVLISINSIFAKDIVLPPVITTNSPTPKPTKEVTPSPVTSPTTPTEPITPTVNITPTAAPTPTTAPVSLDNLPNEYKIYVLNGSGVPGVANQIREKLESGGINVHYAGDAGSFDYSETQILYNQEYTTVANAAEQILTSTYQPLVKRQFELGERYSQYNVVIIHGQ